MSSAAQHRLPVTRSGREASPMKKSVRFLIVGALLVLVAFLANVAARTLTDGAISTTGSILLWVSLLGWLAGAAALIIGLVHALRAAWRWSRTDKAT